MKKILTIISASLLALSISFAQDAPAPISTAEIAEIKSNTVVTGVVVVESAGKPSSAIINDRIVWLEDVVTVREKGKVIVTPRDKREREEAAPSLRLVRVEAGKGPGKGKVTLEYTRDGLPVHTFVKALKSREVKEDGK
jgi:hypothetical protein